jgi:hypothetical protein
MDHIATLPDGGIAPWITSPRRHVAGIASWITSPRRPMVALHHGSRRHGLFISAETEHVEQAWTFVAWLSGRVDALQGSYPARASLAASEEFAHQAPEGAAEVYAAYRELLDRPGKPFEPPSESDEAPVDTYWYYQAVDRALKNPDTLEQELQAAQRLAKQFQACVAGGQTAGACTRVVDPEYQGFMGEAP